MNQKEKIFISHSSEDKKIADHLYNFFKANWPEVSIFYSEESIEPTQDFFDKCISNCRAATIGIIILSDNSIKSQSVQQEIGCFIGCDIERYYIALSASVHKKMGLDTKNQTFSLYKYPDQNVGIQKIAEQIEKKLSLRYVPKKFKFRQEFEQRYMKRECTSHFPSRNQCAILESLKCAENEIRIMGENSLQPIHGGFETLKKFLNDNGNVKVLIADYDAEEYANRENIEDAKKSRRIRSDWIASVSNLFQLNRLKKRGTLEVRYTPEQQIGSLIIIDDWHLQFNQYKILLHDEGTREHDSGVSLFLNKHNGVEKFNYYYSFFDRRWNNPTTKILGLDNIDLTDVVPEKFFIHNIEKNSKTM